MMVAHARHMDELAFLWTPSQQAKEQPLQPASPFRVSRSQDLALTIASGLLVAVLVVTMLVNLD
ncbi:MAG: hypothetical protein WCF85_17130 [Rhodospirillaceae bacterium]